MPTSVTNDEHPSSAQPTDCTPEQLAEARYLKALDTLLADAADSKQIDTLADTLAWTLARVAVGCGIAATGDILRRLGGFICSLETRRQAEEEAVLARQEGRQPN
jgi:hypothetical protein